MKRKSNIARSAFFLTCSVLAFILLYLTFFALGGVAVWYGCMLIEMKFTYPYTLPYDLPSIIIIVLLFGGLLLIGKMFGSLAAIQKINRPDLREIKKAEHPRLFWLIEETAAALCVSPPRKVYLSATISASVFLKTGFWSMLFPLKKRLEIGIGLINALNQAELRTVIAHELGHFSQKTMRLNKPVYIIGQSIRYLTTKIKLKKRDAIEDQYYVFAYLFRSFSELLFSKLSKGFSVLSEELEYDADRIAAEYAGKEVLISALHKVSATSQTFDFTLNSLGLLAASGKGVANFYAAQNSVTPPTRGRLSTLTVSRIEKLQSAEDLPLAPQASAGSVDLITNFPKICISFTQGIYRNQFGVDPSKLDICPMPLYNKWIAKHFSLLEALANSDKEVEVEIALEPRLHRTPLTELFFDVYWDNRKIGQGKCKKGFALKTKTSTGKHALKIEGQCIKDIPMHIVIEKAGKCIVQLNYKHFFLKSYYLFFVNQVK